MKNKLVKAFLLRRRKTMILDFNASFGFKIQFLILQILVGKNMFIQSRMRSGKPIKRIFLYRNSENLAKYLAAEKLNYGQNLVEKTQLMGEALDYPAVAVSDFIQLNQTELQDGDRYTFRALEWGWDGFVFKPEHLSEILAWANKQKIPREKIKISQLKNGRREVVKIDKK